MLEAGCKESPSTKGIPKAEARASPNVDLPQPDTPCQRFLLAQVKWMIENWRRTITTTKIGLLCNSLDPPSGCSPSFGGTLGTAYHVLFNLSRLVPCRLLLTRMFCFADSVVIVNRLMITLVLHCSQTNNKSKLCYRPSIRKFSQLVRICHSNATHDCDDHNFCQELANELMVLSRKPTRTSDVRMSCHLHP